MEDSTFKSALKEVKVGDYVIMCDHDLYPVGQMTTQDEIDTLQRLGGGGLTLGPAIDTAVKKGASSVVILTDEGANHYPHNRHLLCSVPLEIRIVN